MNNEMNLEIVMFNMSSYVEWEKQGIVNRNYHIFNKLLKNRQVKRIIAVDFLPFTFKRALRNYWENNLFGVKGKTIYRDLTTKCVKIDGYRAELYIFSTIDSIFSHKLVIKKLNRVLQKFKHQSSTRIIWSYFPMFVQYFSSMDSDLTIFDTVDNWIEHPSFANHKELLCQNYQIIADKSDLIFTVAEPLLDFYNNLKRNKHVYWVANGVDADHFAKDQSLIIDDKLFDNIPRPIIGYVGTIQHRVNIDLLDYLAKKNKDKSFVLIGPLWSDIGSERLKKHKNIYLLGRKAYKNVPAYIKNFDVAIIPHKIDKFIKYTYSLKALDYLACGRPIVSTPLSGVEEFSDFIYICENYSEFNKKIDFALKNDKLELVNKRIERAKQEDWKFKIDDIMEHINLILKS